MATQTQLLNQTLDGIAKLRERPPDYCKIESLFLHIPLAHNLPVLASASESGDGPQPPTNRGNKLKRKANLVHEGQIYPTDGPATYKRVSVAICQVYDSPGLTSLIENPSWRL